MVCYQGTLNLNLLNLESCPDLESKTHGGEKLWEIQSQYKELGYFHNIAAPVFIHECNCLSYTGEVAVCDLVNSLLQ